MIQPHASPQPVQPGVSDRLDVLADRLQGAMSAGGETRCLADVRQEMRELQADLEDQADLGISGALGRLILLAEVWECVAAAEQRLADEIALFCVRALSQLGRAALCGGSDDVAGAILAQSSASWGDYLVLLEPQGEDLPSPVTDQDPVPELDETPEFDARALLLLFTGQAPEESPGEANETPASMPPADTRIPTDEAPPRLEVGLTLQVPALPRRIELDDELRRAFLADATALFERMEPLVLGLAKAGDPGPSLLELGRCFHTLKGAAGCVGLADLAGLVHSLEEHLPEAKGPALPRLIDILFETLAYIDGLLGLLRAGASSRQPAMPPVDSPAEPEPPASAAEAAAASAPDDGPVRIAGSRLDELMDLASELIARRRLWTAQAECMKTIATLARTCRGRMLACLDRLHESGPFRLDRSAHGDGRAEVQGQLRRLGEVAADLAVLGETARAAAVPLAHHGDALGRLTIQLWDELQAIRVVEIRGLFQRLARVAHDAARVEGRQVDVAMIGESTGLDRAIQDKAFEPLLHVVRNAVAHGIEPSPEREAAGKPPVGQITLEARCEGSTLIIAVQDDGRGLDHEAIAAKARSLGLLAPDEHPGIDRLNSLIFRSGFSTRSSANAISGRGVGMDVVARDIAQLKGSIELQTEPGRGTRLTIRLPARLAFEPAIIVRIDGKPFGLPVAQIVHAQPLPPGESAGRVVTFRDRQIPLVHAREILGLSSPPTQAWPKLLVVRSANELIGLAVDTIEGTEELLIKPLGSLLAGHPLISGTSRAENGEMVCMLAPSGLQHWAGREPGGRRGCPPRTIREDAQAARPAVLVVDDSISVRKVVTRHLEAMGLEVDEASDGLEALGRLRERRYGVVVTDLEMPRLDGFELMAEMRRIKPLASIPVIVASTRVEPEARRRVMDLGARVLLPKPVDPTELAGAVAPLLARPGV